MQKLQCGLRSLDLSQPHIMGILNVTPDSFSDGGQLFVRSQVSVDLALRKAEDMAAKGASIIDVGGESTRPSALPVSLAAEMDRVLPVVERIAQNIDVVISVDTSQPSIMREAVKVGAGLINDVRGLRLSGALAAAADQKVAICLMHMQGDPQTMQHNPEYGDCTHAVRCFLRERIDACVQAGIDPSQILVDPGIGFGKRDEHNLELIKRLSAFKDLFGISRKSMIGRLLGRDLPDRLAGSLGFGLVALQAGAKVLRVHDVAATADIVKIFQLTRI